VIALVYINNGLFLGADKALVDSKKHACLKHWECHDTGDVTDFLGMKVNKTASHITINQKAYLKTVLERFDMDNAKIAPIPILLGYVPQENKGAVDPVWHQKFQSVIRSLLYLMLRTHPDITFTVIKILQFSANPSQDHLKKAMYIMCYLVGTQDYHVVYDGRLNEGLIAIQTGLVTVRKTLKLNSLFFFIYFHPRELKHDSKCSQTDCGNKISHACNYSIVYMPVCACPHSTIKYSKIYVT